MESVICPYCFKNFSNNSSRNRHIKSIHPGEVQIKKKKSIIRCPLCAVEDEQSITTHAILIQHFRDRHDIKIEEEKLIFENNSDFENWRKLEKRDLDYVKTCVFRGEITKVHYSCNRSNTRGFKSNCTKNIIKKGGSIKINGICPSRIVAKFFNEGKVEVKFIKTHVGHALELKRQNSDSYQDRQIAKAHKKAQQRNLDDVKMVDYGKFEVKSSTLIEHFYSVVYGNIGIECDCESLLCRACLICKHKYICECVEYAVKSVMCEHVHMVSLYERRVLAESKSVLCAEVKNEPGDFYIEETSEERLKLNETVNEFIKVKCQDFNKAENSEENLDDETYKDIFHNDAIIKLNKIKDLDITVYKSFATQLTLLLKQFEVDTPKKRKMEKHTYPQPQKKQRKK